MNPVEQLIERMHGENVWEKELVLRRNEFLISRGIINTKLYFVEEGSLRIFVLDGIDEQIIRFGYRNNLIAALDSFITETQTELHIQAIKKTRLKMVRKKVFFEFINSDPLHQEIWREILGLMIYQQMERERDILTSSPVERYKRVLSRSPRLFQEIPHKHIASYLRMTPETLSRIKKS